MYVVERTDDSSKLSAQCVVNEAQTHRPDKAVNVIILEVLDGRLYGTPGRLSARALCGNRMVEARSVPSLFVRTLRSGTGSSSPKSQPNSVVVCCRSSNEYVIYITFEPDEEARPRPFILELGRTTSSECACAVWQPGGNLDWR